MVLIRVKRRLQDDPIDLLLLSCKKPKTSDDCLTKVFTFAATVDEQDGDLKGQINEVKRVKRYPLKYREHSVSAITRKLKSQNKLSSENNRLKVVNWFRTGVDDSRYLEGPDVDGDAGYTVVDLVNADSTTSTDAADDNKSEEVSSASTEEQYVYDLYYSAMGGDIDDLQMENLLSVHAVNEELIFGDFMDDRNDSEEDDDDDDSNDENNWRNDYPDERSEDDCSSDEELMRLVVQMKNDVRIDNEDDDDEDPYDLSSDEQDSLIIYSEDEDRGYYHTEESRSNSSLSSYFSTD